MKCMFFPHTAHRGIIEGAAEGAGLGHDFLRHIDRCRLMLHIVDVSGSEDRDPIADFEKINEELKAYSPGDDANTGDVAYDEVTVNIAGTAAETNNVSKGLLKWEELVEEKSAEQPYLCADPLSCGVFLL